MSFTPLIIDADAPGIGPDGQRVSLLTLPLGDGTVLQYFASLLRPLGTNDALVLQLSADQQRTAALAQSGEARTLVLSPESLKAHASEKFESSDYLLVIDARRWCHAGYDQNLIEACRRDYRGATYFVAIGSDADGTREVVECDAGGAVKRIRRFYNAMNWPEVAGHAIAYAVVPGNAIAGLEFANLPQLRQQLACAGILSRDMPITRELIDLGSESGFLALQEQAIAGWAKSPDEGELLQSSPGLWVGSGCQIHDSVRIVPPVMLQRDVRVDENATLIGPMTVGPGATISRGTTVAHSVIAGGLKLTEQASIRRRVLICNPTGEAALESSTPTDLNSASDDHLFSHHKLELSIPPLSSARQIHFAAKRVLDVVASATALIVLSPLLLAIMILIKLDSPGPIFFLHRRESKGGKDFPCLKFRTMVPDAHQKQRELYQKNEVDGPQFKLVHDPRITRVGRWLRATNLDEIPQLINVVLGHMSLVGPRPSPFRENQICVPWRRARLSVRSGITGLWQICRSEDRARGDFHEWIYYDIMYVRNFSFWLDLKILLGTLLTLGGSWRLPFSWLIKPKPPNVSIGSEITLVSSE